jgi:hypothetical protein
VPADSKAIAYDWFMTTANEIVKFHWEPEGGEIVSSMTVGTVSIHIRNDPDSEWRALEAQSGPVESQGVPWVVAQNMARGDGFTVEVPIYPT